MRLTVSLMMGAVLALSVAADAQQHSDVKPAVPLASVSFIQCGKAIGFYVVVDPKHTIVYRARDTVFMAVDATGEMQETFGAPVPFQQAYDIANSAAIRQNIIAGCSSVTPTI